MSSKFQILDNRPIDKWKVVELKEELKKRRLTTRGLKKDLVKRLDAAVRTEREKAADEADNGSNDDHSDQPAVEKAAPTIAEKVKHVADHGGLKLKDDTADCAAASGHGHGVAESHVENEGRKLDERDEKNDSISTNSVSITAKTGLKDTIIDDNVKMNLDVVKSKTVEPYSSNGSGQGVAEERDMLVEDEPVIHTTVVKTVIPEVPLIGQHLQSSKLEENVNSNMQMECQDLKPQVENEDDMHGSSALNNQVSEISPISGFQVKPESIATDPMSITGKSELKGNIVDDNVMSEMVEPYSSSGSGQGVVEEMGMLVENEPVIPATKVKTMIPEVPLIGQHLQSSKQEENVNSNMQMESQDRKLEVESDDPMAQLENEDRKDEVHERFKDEVDHGGSELKFKGDISDCEAASGHGVVEEANMLVEDKPVVTDVPLVGEHLQSSKPEENVNSNTQIECQDGNPQVVIEVPLIEEHLESSKREENVNSNKQMECQDAKSQVENEDDPMTQLENEDYKDDMREKVKDVVDHGGGEIEKGSGLKSKDDISDHEAVSGHGVVEESDMVEDKPVVIEVPLVGENLQSSKQKETVNSNTQMECHDGKPQVVTETPLIEEHLSSKREENVNSNKQIECQDVKSENEDDPMAQLENPMAPLENEDHKDDMHEKVEDVVDHGDSEIEKGSGLKFKDDIRECEAASGHGVVEESDMLVEDKPVVIDVPLVEEHLQSSKPEENVNSNTQMKCQDGKPQVVTEGPLIEEHLQSSKREEIVNSNKQMECQDAKSQVGNEDDLMDQLENEDHKDEMHEKVKDEVDHGGSVIEKVSGLKFKDDISDCAAASGHGVVDESNVLVEDKPVLTEVPLIGGHFQSLKPEENVNSNTQMEYQDRKPQVEIEEHLESSQRQENVNSNKQMECQDSKPQVENEGLKVEVETEDPKAQLENGDGMHDPSSLNNQLPEINLVSGFQVKSDSFSNDSMSINEKIELKDNISDENVKLSQDVVKLEMVEPCSSTNVVPNNGESHPLDDDEQPLRNKASVDEIDENNDTTADMNNKDDSEEMGYSEKLNLDRSSTDDSMEEDLPETKQIDSKCITDEIEDDSVEELESTVVAGDGSSTEQKDIFVENKSRSSGKRKLQDEEAIENSRPPKRHKRISDHLQVPEQQATFLTPISMPKDTMQIAASQSNFSSSDSTDSEDTPKEQDVPPSQKTPTTSLRVDNFLRPFTLKAVQQLLGKTGIITSFWMDHIKTHCYVTYSSVEEAIETRNALYNLQWPPNGGRLLVAEFVDPHEVQTLTSQPQPSAHQHVSPPSEKRLPVPPPSPPSEEPDSPMVTLDDLFWKTKATPKIYYLPLSEDQVAAKQATLERNNKNW
ncbi:hypothetical protein V6N13_112096 [Hibiscus sabdariffa]|uniref:SAP domain-containing protein n=1 Tax=Hibiscus sabdariffa TaxID=183260 RepID=A0ABR2TMJ4_9ROSI